MKKTWDDLKNDKEQKNIYRENAKFVGSTWVKHEREMSKLSWADYYLIKILPFIFFIAMIYALTLFL